jgi:hypothetical protein
MSCQGPDEGLLREMIASGDGVAAELREVVTETAGDFFGEVEWAQSPEASRNTGLGKIREEGLQVGAADAPEVEFRSLQSTPSRQRFSERVQLAAERNTRSVAFPTCLRLQ